MRSSQKCPVIVDLRGSEYFYARCQDIERHLASNHGCTSHQLSQRGRDQEGDTPSPVKGVLGQTSDQMARNAGTPGVDVLKVD